MSTETVIAGLAIAGLILELGGLTLVVAGIRSDRRAAREAGEGGSESDLRLRVRSSLGLKSNEEGREPTVEERLERLEARVGGLLDREHTSRDELQDYVNQKLSQVERGGIARDETLRRFLKELLEGDLQAEVGRRALRARSVPRYRVERLGCTGPVGTISTAGLVPC